MVLWSANFPINVTVPAAIVCGMAAFSISDVFTKLVALTHPLGEVFAVRGLFAILLMGTVMVLMGIGATGVQRSVRPCLRVRCSMPPRRRSMLPRSCIYR